MIDRRFLLAAFVLLFLLESICCRTDRGLAQGRLLSSSGRLNNGGKTSELSSFGYPFWKDTSKTVRGGSELSASQVIQSPEKRDFLWSVPFIAAILAFWSFPWVSLLFHRVVQWASSNTWIPDTEEQVNLQTNVVTQVVNGPVITSVSVLFATLVSMTVSNLHNRQVEIRRSLVSEVRATRQLQHMLSSPAANSCLAADLRIEALSYVDRHGQNLLSESQSEDRHEDSCVYIASCLLSLLDWYNQLCCTKEYSKSIGMQSILSQVQTLTNRILEERSNRWLAMSAMHFPTVHYFTLFVLATSIGIAFLVATDEAEFIFLRGLPVRILWTVLISSFSALGVVCYDLANAFAGAYHVHP